MKIKRVIRNIVSPFKMFHFFLKNVWFFRKELWEFRWWDYSYNLDIFRRSLEKTAYMIEFHGTEVDESRMKKVKKMKRVIELLNNVRTDAYLSIAEKELGELRDYEITFRPLPNNNELYEMIDNQGLEDKSFNKKIYDRAKQIEDEEWEEIWNIIRGQNMNKYHIFYNARTEAERKQRDLWKEWYDGSNMKHWWD